MCLKSSLGDNLHSVYVYGSVARKQARVGESNLDLVVVTLEPLGDDKTTIFNNIRWRVQRQFPQVTGVAIKTTLMEEVASLDSLFSWGFLLKHCSVCVLGSDLAYCFGEYEPSWEIAKYWNMDVDDWLAVYRHKIARAGQREEQIKAQRMIAKKLLRASYSLVMPKDKGWYDDPIECGEHFLKYYPQYRTVIFRLGVLYKGELIPKRSVIGLLDSFGEWLVKQYQKTEFKIG